MTLRPYSATALVIGGAIAMALGLYFIFLRPPVLPEDLRFMGTSMTQLEASLPGLLIWLRRVFWVLGGYMFATGLLTLYLAQVCHFSVHFPTSSAADRHGCSGSF